MAKMRTSLLIAAMVFLCSSTTGAQTITRGPYLQSGTPTSVVVKWRTDVAIDSRVRFGFAPDELQLVAEDTSITTEHAVTLSNLSPDTKYYYTIETSLTTLAGDSSYFFVTSPSPGVSKPTRIWILGDSGTKNNAARAVRDAYYDFTGNRHTDLWLMLGDNAYQNGVDADYQAAVFSMYPEMLRKSVLWPTRGNHDRGPRDEFGDWTNGGDYYNIFTLPKSGEAGGLPSGTEVYYSFDYSDIHFICLESTSSDYRQLNSPMWSWLEADLAANDKFWTIAFWHHPPYSKGSHDSDAESELIQMREIALPILESYGVDLVLCGHSHSYERSFLLNGHYGNSTTLADSMVIDAGNGREDGDGAYLKFVSGFDPNAGAVYVVAGCSGQLSPAPLDHPVMFASIESNGSVVLDIDGNRADASFINSSGEVLDYFSIIKTAGSTADSLVVISGNDQTGFIGTTLPEALVVQAQDSSGTPLSGVPVSFAVISGNAVLSNPQQSTNLNGLASTNLTFGALPGAIQVAAMTEGVADTAFFTAAAVVPPFPSISVAPEHFDFGSVLIGDSLSTNFQIKNLGVDSLVIIKIAVVSNDSSHFRFDSLALPLVLLNNISQNMTIQFEPLSVGLKQTTVRFESNDPEKPIYGVSLTGIGAAEYPPVTVLPKITTTSTPSNADDPAIWIHPTDPARSVIIGTDKSAGIFVWDMNGNQLQHLPQGTEVNNVDARQNVRWGNEVADIIAANLRNAAKLALFKVNPNYTGADVLVQLAGETSLNNDIQNDSYGFCLYRHPADSTLYVFERPKGGGEVRQYRIEPDTSSGGVLVNPVRDLNYTGNTAEGFVADDDLGFVYITEEGFGIHKYFAAPDTPADVLATFGQGDGTQTDREGLALYACADGTGYLVLSSQGNSTFKIFERQGNNRFLKTMVPLDEFGNAGLGTDGLDVTSSAAPSNFPKGFLVAHEQSDKQFHLYDWAEIAEDNLSICVNGHFPKPRIVVAPAALDLGEVAVGDSSQARLLIRNAGDADLTIFEISLLGDEFKIDSLAAPFVLMPGDSLSLHVLFRPNTVGEKNTVLKFISNSEDHNPLEIILTGTAVLIPEPRIAVTPATYDFGEVAVNDTASITLVVKNGGDAELLVSEISLFSSDEFKIDSLAMPLVLSPLESFSFNVAFAPVTIGAKAGTLLFISNDTDRDSLQVSLSGSAFLPGFPAISVSPNALVFNEVRLDSTASRKMFVYNRGSGDLHVIDIQVVGMDASEFSIADSLSGEVITASDSEAVVVTFAPHSVGEKRASVQIVSDAANSDSLEVSLIGVAVNGPILGVDEKDSPLLPDRIFLKPNYPNPFNAETTIEYALPKFAHVRLVIYNLLGQPIRVLSDGTESAGFKKVHWNGRDRFDNELGSGIYFVQLEAGGMRFINKITLLK